MNPDKKDIRCDLCQKSFKNKVGLTRHLRKVHPTEYESIMEKEVRAEYKANLEKVDRTYDEMLITNRILEGKYELYLLHDRVDDAIEQLRQQILLFIKHYTTQSNSSNHSDLDPLFYAQNAARNCIVGFVYALNKKYKDNIPEIILEKLGTMINEFESASLKLKDIPSEILKRKEAEVLLCPFCGRLVKSRGGLSNHLSKAHTQEYLIQLQFELDSFERHLLAITCREPEPPPEKKLIQDDSTVLRIVIKISFNMSIENDFETLEHLRERREFLIESRKLFSQTMYDHLLTLSNYDIEHLMNVIESRKKAASSNKESYHFDAEIKQELIIKYHDLIDTWKSKIKKLSEKTNSD